MSSEPHSIPLIKDLFLCVEWSDLCDVRCEWCEQATRATPHGHPRGFMDIGMFRHLMEDLRRLPLPLFGMAPHWLGESMLHPRYGDLVRTAFEANEGNRAFGFFSTNTNGISLDAGVREAILEASARGDQRPGTFKLLFLSIDAARPGTFTRLKGRDSLGVIEENAEALLVEMVRRGLEFPRVVAKFIVMEENEAEAGEFLEKWREIFRRSGVPRIQVNYDHEPHFDHHAIFFDKIVGREGPGRAEEIHREVATRLGLVPPAAQPSPGRLIHSDEQIDRAAPRRPCPALWKSPMVDWQGNLVPCCNDSQGRLLLGNLASRSFTDLWYGPKVHDMRVRHVLGDFGFEPCNRCPNQRYPCMTDSEIEEYLRFCGNADLWERYRERMGNDAGGIEAAACRSEG